MLVCLMCGALRPYAARLVPTWYWHDAGATPWVSLTPNGSRARRLLEDTTHGRRCRPAHMNLKSKQNKEARSRNAVSEHPALLQSELIPGRRRQQADETKGR